MAKADSKPTTIPLYALFTDPVLRDAFWRAGSEDGDSFALTADRPQLLSGGTVAVRALELA